MKILCVLNDLDIGGAQNYTISLMNEFVKLGHQVELRVLSDNLQLKRRINSQVRIQVWERKKKIDFHVLSKIRNEIKYNHYDAVIASYIIYQKLSTVFLKNKPINIYPIHSTIPKSKKAILFNHIIFRCKWKNEIFLTSIDNQTKYLSEVYNLRQSFFEQIYNGVDTNKFILPPAEFNRNEFLKSKGINSKNKIILMVAGYRKEKRHVDAIEAFILLQNVFKDISLVFVGDNRIDEYNMLLEYAKTKNASNIYFFTASAAGDVRNFYWSSDIFTLTSNRVETFPITVLEAMACGLPCVLTDIGGAVDIIIEGNNGYLVEPGNIKSIKNGWKKTLQDIGYFDKQDIRKNIITKYSIQNSASQYLNLMESVIT